MGRCLDDMDRSACELDVTARALARVNRRGGPLMRRGGRSGGNGEIQPDEEAFPVIMPTPIRFTTRGANSIESESGGFYSYAGTPTASQTNGPSKVLPASADGYFQIVRGPSAGDQASAVIGWATSGTGPLLYSGLSYGFFAGTINSAGKYAVTSLGVNPAPNVNANIVSAVGDLMRVRRSLATMVCEISKDSGATWQTVHIYAGVSTAQLWPSIQYVGASLASTVACAGLI